MVHVRSSPETHVSATSAQALDEDTVQSFRDGAAWSEGRTWLAVVLKVMVETVAGMVWVAV